MIAAASHVEELQLELQSKGLQDYIVCKQQRCDPQVAEPRTLTERRAKTEGGGKPKRNRCST